MSEIFSKQKSSKSIDAVKKIKEKMIEKDAQLLLDFSKKVQHECSSV